MGIYGATVVHGMTHILTPLRPPSTTMYSSPGGGGGQPENSKCKSDMIRSFISLDRPLRVPCRVSLSGGRDAWPRGVAADREAALRRLCVREKHRARPVRVWGAEKAAWRLPSAARSACRMPSRSHRLARRCGSRSGCDEILGLGDRGSCGQKKLADVLFHALFHG